MKTARTALSCGVSLVCLASGVQAGEALASGRLRVEVSNTGSIGVRYGGAVIVNRDMLQLVDTSAGWRPVFQCGPTARLRRRADEARIEVGESVPAVMECRKTVALDGRGVGWEQSWDVPGGTGAQWNYYFIDIPADLLKGAACEFEAAGSAQIGRIPESIGAMRGLKSVVFYTGALRIRYDLTAENVVWKLTDWSGTAHNSYRLRIEERVEEGLRAAVGVRLSVAPSTQAAASALLERSRRQEEARRQEQLAALGMVCAKALAIGQPVLSSESVPRGAKLEISIALDATFDNPFDPEQVEVVCEIRTPDGRRERLPAFFHTPVQLAGDGRLEGYGPAGWRVRYTPRVAGTHIYTIRARDRNGAAETPQGTFRCTDADFGGWVRVSKSQPLALEWGSGKPFVPIGFNLFHRARLGQAYPHRRLATLQRYVTRLADAGGNFVRLRMDSWWLAIECTADEATGHLGPGFYNQRVCDEVDRIYQLAEDRGIQIMHCLYNANGMVNRSAAKGSATPWRRPYAFFLEENGGSCDEITDFWTDEEAIKRTRMRLRYCVARWGYSPSCMAWEFWNELVLRQDLMNEQVGWHRDMARFLRALDPWEHPITNSLMPKDFDRHDPLWRLPEMDIVQYHSYRGRELPGYMAEVAAEAVRRWRKPFFFGECGIIHEDRSQGAYAYDPDGLHLHNGLWAPLFAQAAGAGAFWFIESFVDKNDLYHHYGALARWTGDVPWTAARMEPLNVASLLNAVVGYSDGGVPRGKGDPFVKAGAERFVIDPASGEVENGEHFQSMLHAGADRKSRPTLVLDCGREAVLAVRVTRSVGDGGNRLKIALDGVPFLEKPYPAGEEHGTARRYVEQYGNWICSYDDTVLVPLPAGRHEVVLEAFGRDRIEIECGLRSYFRRPALLLRGLRAGAAAWFWVRHRSSTAYGLREGKAWEPVAGAEAVLRGFPEGRYAIEWYDTWKGEVLRSDPAEAVGGELRVRIPPVRRSLAAKVRPAPTPKNHR